MPNPDQGGLWGVLGGSFDPVHKGHLNLAQGICKEKRLDGVLFIPAHKHPLKKKAFTASYSDRVQMLKLALSGNDHLHLCEIEKEQNLTGYTIDTMLALKKRFPKARFFFIIGTDLVEQLDSWYRAKELLEETNFLAGSRPGSKLKKDDSKKNLEFVEIEELDISASNIRTQIKEGATISKIAKLVPAGVAKYIVEKGLYR